MPVASRQDGIFLRVSVLLGLDLGLDLSGPGPEPRRSDGDSIKVVVRIPARSSLESLLFYGRTDCDRL